MGGFFWATLAIVAIYLLSNKSRTIEALTDFFKPFYLILALASVYALLWWCKKSTCRTFIKQLPAKYFPKCYECKAPNAGNEKCSNCGNDLTIKYIKQPSLTIKKLISSSFWVVVISGSSVIIALSIDNIREIYKFSGDSYGEYADGSCAIKNYPYFAFGQKVNYKKQTGTIKSIIITDNFIRSYTIKVGDKLIPNISESELIRMNYDEVKHRLPR
ncbi:MAG: hypothetical protein GY750_01955 [Lentisphaerae bacterium]|nr:hypothetical protein [Lentisphaerota bacterium]MCP4100185.1 hypothetical protein [Lentisphaerota bacterium]